LGVQYDLPAYCPLNTRILAALSAGNLLDIREANLHARLLIL
jgi:hypothetical protein